MYEKYDNTSINKAYISKSNFFICSQIYKFESLQKKSIFFLHSRVSKTEQYNSIIVYSIQLNFKKYLIVIIQAKLNAFKLATIRFIKIFFKNANMSFFKRCKKRVSNEIYICNSYLMQINFCILRLRIVLRRAIRGHNLFFYFFKQQT